MSRRTSSAGHGRPAAVAIAAAVVAAVLTASAAVPASASPAPEPATAPEVDTGRPGDVLRMWHTDFRIVPGVDTATTAWRIHYRSTAADGSPNTVSGTVIVPEDGRSPATPRPLVTYAVGTVGMGDRCAPSRTFPQGTTTEGPLIAGALARGWAVVVTDYEGLGTPGDHTYTVGRAEGTAVLDAARAALRMPGAARHGLTGGSPVGIMGYSQGGQASGWAAELQAGYAPELNVKGTAGGGVPADLAGVAGENNGGDNAGLVLMSAIGHDAAFPALHLEKYLNEEGTKLTDFMRGNCLDEISEAGAGKNIDDVTVENPLNDEAWQRALAADRLGTKRTAQPVYLYHGSADETIPYEVGRQLKKDWCARGTSVTWRTYPMLQHVDTAMTGSAPAMNWLAARFAGLPARSDC